MSLVVLQTTSAAVEKEQRLRADLAAMPSALVAFSGGVDSTYLLAVAHDVLGPRAIAVTADSASLARTSLAEAREFCAARGIEHRIVATDEFDHEEYRANDGRRCYHCKSALMRAMSVLKGEGEILVGVIADDFGDVRPGLQAAREGGARWPLADAGFTKADVRARSRALGLPTWSRPAEPCLSSRVPYGERVEPEGLRMIEAAEEALRAHGLPECRARHHRIGDGRGYLCRIEVPETELARVLDNRAAIVARLTQIGYVNVALDLAGLKSGGFNAMLRDSERP